MLVNDCRELSWSVLWRTVTGLTVFDTVRSDLQEGTEIVLVTLSSIGRDLANHKCGRNQQAKLIRGINKTQKISINRKKLCPQEENNLVYTTNFSP